MSRFIHNEVVVNNRFIAVCSVLIHLPVAIFATLTFLAFILPLNSNVTVKEAQRIAELAHYNWILLGIALLYLVPSLLLIFFIMSTPASYGKATGLDYSSVQTAITDSSMLSLLRLLFCSLLVIINSWNIILVNWIAGRMGLYDLLNSIFTSSMVYWYIPGLVLLCAIGMLDDLMLWSGIISKISN